jgi:hypothetical protein
VLRAERVALERQRLAAVAAAREEEEHAKILAERRELEARRRQLEQDALARMDAQRQLDEVRLKAALRGEGAASGGPVDEDEEEFLSPRRQLKETADSRIKASREFASALSLSIMKDLEEDTVAVPDRAQLDADVAHLKQARIEYSKTHSYSGTVRGKQKHGRGRYQLDAKGEFFYEGAWVADKKHGRGAVSLPSTVYDGDWKDDKPSGRGILQTKHVKASATFSNGVVHGNAVVQMNTGESFGGKVKSNDTTSPGALTMASGDRIEWQAGDPNRPGSGSAIVAYASGDSYIGSIVDWQLHGNGQYLFGDTGDVYVGTFTNNEMTGTGVYTFADGGGVYEGAVVNGSFEGAGKFAVADMVYEGEWLGGKMHGRGTITYANGDVWRGNFDNDRRVKGKYVFSKAFALQ